jgi:hypothetical protein
LHRVVRRDNKTHLVLEVIGPTDNEQRALKIFRSEVRKHVKNVEANGGVPARDHWVLQRTKLNWQTV